MNNSTTSTNYHFHAGISPHLQIVILSLILAACLFGNLLVIVTIIRTKKLRIYSNFLIVNLSVCDMMTAIGGIPFTLMIYNIYYKSKYYPYGEVGCKILWPFTTYAHNCSVFTLAVIAFERYLNISFIHTKLTKRRSVIVIVAIHILAIIVVIPYSINLKHVMGESEVYCYEEWGDEWHKKVYTISLFIIQYALPLNLMTIFYLLAWRTLYSQNNLMIKMSEDYERKMDWESSYPNTPRSDSIVTKLSWNLGDNDSISNTSFMTNTSSMFGNDPSEQEVSSGSDMKIISKSVQTMSDETGVNSIRRKRRYLHRTDTIDKTLHGKYTKSQTPTMAHQKFSSVRHSSSIGSLINLRRFNTRTPYSSKTAYVRHRQSIKILKMFSVVVIVFACFALPNQLIWLLHDFSHLPVILSDIFILFTYVSPMVNCWIYGGFHRGIRKAYIRTICCCYYKKRMDRNISNPMATPFYNSRQEELFRRRMSFFNEMFDNCTENLGQRKHLYPVVNIAEETENIDECTGGFIDDALLQDVTTK